MKIFYSSLFLCLAVTAAVAAVNPMGPWVDNTEPGTRDTILESQTAADGKLVVEQAYLVPPQVGNAPDEVYMVRFDGNADLMPIQIRTHIDSRRKIMARNLGDRESPALGDGAFYWFIGNDQTTAQPRFLIVVRGTEEVANTEITINPTGQAHSVLAKIDFNFFAKSNTGTYLLSQELMPGNALVVLDAHIYQHKLFFGGEDIVFRVEAPMSLPLEKKFTITDAVGKTVDLIFNAAGFDGRNAVRWLYNRPTSGVGEFVLRAARGPGGLGEGPYKISLRTPGQPVLENAHVIISTPETSGLGCAGAVTVMARNVRSPFLKFPD